MLKGPTLTRSCCFNDSGPESNLARDTKGWENIAGTSQAGRCCGDEGRREVSPALLEAQGKITFAMLMRHFSNRFSLRITIPVGKGSLYL